METAIQATEMLAAAIRAVEKYRQLRKAHLIPAKATEDMFLKCYPERDKLIADIRGDQ